MQTETKRFWTGVIASSMAGLGVHFILKLFELTKTEPAPENGELTNRFGRKEA